ncbi:CU044_2847 family protein [Streptomyces sp. NRRL S-87]|uniref:CU044_2847 family protein n=1 Tax=Streptomyces sp. NRRL S-87 TaxID=1463920 RepID=UPI0004C26189|nr:CU044_2847 family protein [Streptomyces sp. NRRL S-87]
MADELVSVELDGKPVLMRVSGAGRLPLVPAQGTYPDPGGAAHGGTGRPTGTGTGTGKYADTGKYTDTGKVADRVARGIEGLDDLVRGVAGAMRRATEALEPQQVSVSFGIELAAKPGKVVSLLADVEGKAALTVTLTWQNDRQDGGHPDGRADGRDRGRSAVRDDGPPTDGPPVDGPPPGGPGREARG